MKEYRWSDIHVGLKEEFEAVFSAEDAAAFALLSGDANPLHVDGEYAMSVGFSGPVLFGMMTSSLYSRLVGVYLPGKFALLQGVKIDFNSPCQAGECLHLKGEVVYMNEAYRQFEIKAAIRKSDNKIVSKATIKVGFHAS